MARRARRARGRDRREQLTLSAAAASAGLGSFLFHGPQPRGAGVVHNVSVVSVCLCVAADHRGARPLQHAADSAPYRSGLVFLSFALIALVLGRTESRLCDPDRFLQLHGLWHILGALALDSYSRTAAERS
jgi:hypothetical protein